jgi:hypothetical protein
MRVGRGEEENEKNSFRGLVANIFSSDQIPMPKALNYFHASERYFVLINQNKCYAYSLEDLKFIGKFKL